MDLADLANLASQFPYRRLYCLSCAPRTTWVASPRHKSLPSWYWSQTGLFPRLCHGLPALEPRICTPLQPLYDNFYVVEQPSLMDIHALYSVATRFSLASAAILTRLQSPLVMEHVDLWGVQSANAASSQSTFHLRPSICSLITKSPGGRSDCNSHVLATAGGTRLWLAAYKTSQQLILVRACCDVRRRSMSGLFGVWNFRCAPISPGLGDTCGREGEARGYRLAMSRGGDGRCSPFRVRRVRDQHVPGESGAPIRCAAILGFPALDFP